jgi:aspartyl-tRNA(Asn)/glutamyl-tRNA(Gln) amidotransferase subunit C
MKLGKEEVAHVAALARIKLSGDQLDQLTGQLNDILGAMDKLAEVDTSGVSATNHALALTGAQRPDVVRPSLPREQGLASAPASDGQSFVVPRVL